MCKIHVPATIMACPYYIQATSGDHKLSLLNRVLISFDKEDEWLRWSNTKGWFSIKYFYNVLFGGELRDEGWKSNWNNLVPLKILACCGWLLGFKKTLATDKHEKKGHILVNGCLLCLVAEDSTNRLLIHWTFAARVWVTVLKRFGICWAMRRTIIEASVFRSSKKKKRNCRIYHFLQEFENFGLSNIIEFFTMKVLLQKKLWTLLCAMFLIGLAGIRTLRMCPFKILLDHGYSFSNEKARETNYELFMDSPAWSFKTEFRRDFP